MAPPPQGWTKLFKVIPWRMVFVVGLQAGWLVDQMCGDRGPEQR